MKIVFPIVAALALCVPTVAAAADRIDVYPLDTCAVAAKSKLGSMGDPVVMEHEGREVRFCCDKCVGKFKKDPEKILASIDERILAQQKASYPLTTCVVSGEELGEKAQTFVVNQRVVKTCCKMCMRKVQKSPEGFLAKVDEAIVAQQSENYPLDTCAVSGEELGSMGKPLDVVVGGRLVKICCKGCKKGIKKDPVAVLAEVEAAWSKKKGKAEKKPGKGAEKKAGKGTASGS